MFAESLRMVHILESNILCGLTDSKHFRRTPGLWQRGSGAGVMQVPTQNTRWPVFSFDIYRIPGGSLSSSLIKSNVKLWSMIFIKCKKTIQQTNTTDPGRFSPDLTTMMDYNDERSCQMSNKLTTKYKHP